MVETLDTFECPVCGKKMIVGADKSNKNPVWYCDHGTETLCIFFAKNYDADQSVWYGDQLQ